MITLVIYSALTIATLLFTTILDVTQTTIPSSRSKRASA